MDGMSQDSDNLIVILCLTLLLEGEFSTFSKSLLNTDKGDDAMCVAPSTKRNSLSLRKSPITTPQT